jgi:hypothetical protein
LNLSSILSSTKKKTKNVEIIQQHKMDLYDEFGNYVGPEISKASPERQNNAPSSSNPEDKMDEDTNGNNNNNMQLITPGGLSFLSDF